MRVCPVVTFGTTSAHTKQPAATSNRHNHNNQQRCRSLFGHNYSIDRCIHRVRVVSHTSHTQQQHATLTRHQVKANGGQAEKVKGRVIVLQHDEVVESAKRVEGKMGFRTMRALFLTHTISAVCTSRCGVQQQQQWSFCSTPMAF